MTVPGCSTDAQFLKHWQGNSLHPIDPPGLSVNNFLKAHNVSSPAHVWVSLFKSGLADGGTNIQMNKREVVEPGRCLLMIEYREPQLVGGRLSVASAAAGVDDAASKNPRRGQEAKRCYYTKSAILDAMESLQSAKEDQALEFSPREVDLVRYELFVQLQPGARKVTAKSLVAIVDPALVPGGTALTAADFLAGKSSPTPSMAGGSSRKPAAKKSAGGSRTGDLALDDLMSVGGKSSASKAPVGTSSLGGGSLTSIALGLGQKRDRNGMPSSASEALGGSPTLSQLLEASDTQLLGGGAGNNGLAGAAPLTPAQQVLENTRQRLSQSTRDPPLHKALPGIVGGVSGRRGGSSSAAPQGSRQGILLGEVTWYRYHPHTLSAVIPPSATGSPSSAGLGLGSSGGAMANARIAGFAIDGTLFNTALKDKGSDAFELIDKNLPELLEAVVANGFRLVLFASYPSLHHSSMFALQEKTERIVKFCRKYIPHLPVTVMLSTVSSFQADSIFHMPRTGLMDCFVQYHNNGILPNPTLSFYCGNLYDKELYDVQSGRSKKRKDESAAASGADDAEGRWTYQSVDGADNSDPLQGSGNASKKEDIPSMTQDAATAEWDVDHSFAQATGLRFVPNLDFYARKGVPSVF